MDQDGLATDSVDQTVDPVADENNNYQQNGSAPVEDLSGFQTYSVNDPLPAASVPVDVTSSVVPLAEASETVLPIEPVITPLVEEKIPETPVTISDQISPLPEAIVPPIASDENNPNYESIPMQQEIPQPQAEAALEPAVPLSQTETFAPTNVGTSAFQAEQIQPSGIAPLPADVAAPVAKPGISGLFQNQKMLYIIIGSIGGIIIMSLLAYFAYGAYVSSSDERILASAAKNIINGKNMEVAFSVGASGFSVNGKLFVDKEQNLKFTLDNDLFPIEAIYIKKKDTAYLKSFDIFGSSKDDKKVPYYEGKNVEKAIKKYGMEDLGIDSLNPTKNYFTAENLKNFKREADEKMNGVDLYKYSFLATDADIKKATDEANKKIAEYSPDTKIKKIKNTTTMWIKKGDYNLYKVSGETYLEYSQKEDDYSKCSPSTSSDVGRSIEPPCDYTNLPKKEVNQKYTFTWGLDIKGGYKETIALAKDSTISDSVDLSTYQEELKKTSNDSQKISNVRMLQTSLETYYADNRSYPKDLNLLIPKYLKSLPKNSDGTKFTYTIKNNIYEISVKLEKPDKNDPNVENGYYTVGGDTPSNDTIVPLN